MLLQPRAPFLSAGRHMSTFLVSSVPPNQNIIILTDKIEIINLMQSYSKILKIKYFQKYLDNSKIKFQQCVLATRSSVIDLIWAHSNKYFLKSHFVPRTPLPPHVRREGVRTLGLWSRYGRVRNIFKACSCSTVAR